jgi:hypothetical protein
MGCASAFAEERAEPHRVFALAAAMGDRFSAVHEVQSTGTNLPPYRRRSLDVQGDGLNKVVLKALGDAVAATDPGAERIYLSVRRPGALQDRPSSLEESALDTVLEQLRGMPRGAWHRIVVATPAWRNSARDGLANGMGGIGLFTQPLCQGDIRFCDTRSRPGTAGVSAQTPSGETETASRFVAPFFFARITILDPATLEVLDTQEIFDHDKLFDPDSGAMDMNQSVDRKVLAAKIVGRIEASALEAVRRSELRGTVDVKERGEVTPAR